MPDKEIVSFHYECSCGCGALKFVQDKKDGFSYISYDIPAFYAYQETVWSRLKSSLKLIWCAITGKQYRLYEVIIDDNEKLRRFKEFVANMREIDESS